MCDFLLVINTNLPPILHRLEDTAFDRSKIAILLLTPQTEGFPWDDLHKNFSWMSMDGQGTKCHRNIAENFNRLSRVHARYRQTTDDKQTTDERMTAYSEHENSSHSLIKTSWIRKWHSKSDTWVRTILSSKTECNKSLMLDNRVLWPKQLQ